jgi:hypothetical protein
MLKRTLAIPFILIMLAACGGLGLQPAQSFQDRVAYALGVHTAVLQSATSAVNFGDITTEEARSLLELSDRARNLIDVARTVHAAGDIEGANQRLALALTVLQEIQNYLRRSDV